MIRQASFFMTLATVLLLVGPASAATLKGDVALDGTVLTVGDVFSDAGQFAGYELAPAPAPGKSLTLTARDLKRVADTFGLDWKPQTGNERAVITNAHAPLDRGALLEALGAQAGPGIEIQLPESLPNISLAADADLTVESFTVDDQHQTFSARVSVPDARGSAQLVTLTGRAFTLVDVPVLKETLASGDVISKADITHVMRRANTLASDVVLTEAQMIGKTPRRSATAGQPVQSRDLEAPTLVKRGQQVTVTLKNGPISLSLLGRAMQNGSEGDTVRILNSASNQVIEGVVTGAQTVAVTPPTAALVN